MKLLLKLTVIVVIFVLAWNYAHNQSPEGSLVSVTQNSGSLSINIREKEKDELKTWARKIKDLVYREATIHNPSGDMVPDQIDNKVLQEVKEKVN